MTTLKTNTISEIISKTSLKTDTVASEVLIICMNSGFNFIHSFRMAKELQKKLSK